MINDLLSTMTLLYVVNLIFICLPNGKANIFWNTLHITLSSNQPQSYKNI